MMSSPLEVVDQLTIDYPHIVPIQLPSFIFSDESYSKISDMETWLYDLDAKMNDAYAFIFVKGTGSPLRSGGWSMQEGAPKVVFGFKEAGIAAMFKLAWA